MDLTTTHYGLIALLFVWSLINLVYYLQADTDDKFYVVSFILVLIFQIIFYFMVLLEQLGLYTRPYPEFYTELSFKRNLVFAILAVLVSATHACRYRMFIRKVVNGD